MVSQAAFVIFLTLKKMQILCTMKASMLEHGQRLVANSLSYKISKFAPQF